MKKAIVLLAEGFEEGESLLTIDILRRAGISCVSSSIKDREVKGCNGISAIAVTLNIMIYVNGRIRFNDLMYGILVLALCLILFRTAFLIGFRMKMFLTQCN